MKQNIFQRLKPHLHKYLKLGISYTIGESLNGGDEDFGFLWKENSDKKDSDTLFCEK